MVVATWNLENLYRPGGEFGPRTDAAYRAKLRSLAGVIAAVAPDVLAVQEVGEPEALDDLVDELDGTWHVALSQLEDARGIRVGFLSRLPIAARDEVRRWPAPLAPVQVNDRGDRVAELSRGALRVRVGSGRRTVDLLTCHLKSKLLTYPNGRFSPRDEGERARFGAYALYRRAGEAVTVRAAADRLLDGRGRERSVVVLGDLNDEPQAATTQILLGPPGSELETPGFEPPDEGELCRLWNVAPKIPAERRFSRVFRSRPELIDHILVSHELVTRLAGADTTGDAPSITEDRAARRDDPASDHRLVVARFDF